MAHMQAGAALNLYLDHGLRVIDYWSGAAIDAARAGDVCGAWLYAAAHRVETIGRILSGGLTPDPLDLAATGWEELPEQYQLHIEWHGGLPHALPGK